MTTSAEAPVSPEQFTAASMLQLALGYMPAQIIHVAIRLRIPELLGERAMTSTEIATATGAHPSSLRRLLRALTTFGVIADAGEDRLTLTPAGNLLRPDVPHSVWPLVMTYHDERMWRSWGELLHSVRTGEAAFEHVTGMTAFDYFGADPDRSVVFNRAMATGTATEAELLARGHDFARFGELVDVGGGNGTLLAAILNAHPGVRGVLFDTAAGVREAAPVLRAAGVADRCRIEVGDFFAGVPGGADAYLLKSVLHDWQDERCVSILRSCRHALAPSGRVLIVEMVLPDAGTVVAPFAVISDINLMVTTHGRERTVAEFKRLLAEAGLELISIGPASGSGHRVLEAVPAG